MLLNCGVEDSWESLGLQEDPTSPSLRKPVVNIHWRNWYWSWNSSTLVTWCEELTHVKRPWCWERLKVGGEGDDRGWDGWMASPTQWTWVWASFERWWRIGKPVCCSPWGCKESDMIEQLNNNNKYCLKLHNLRRLNICGKQIMEGRKREALFFKSSTSSLRSIFFSVGRLFEWTT